MRSVPAGWLPLKTVLRNSKTTSASSGVSTTVPYLAATLGSRPSTKIRVSASKGSALLSLSSKTTAFRCAVMPRETYSGKFTSALTLASSTKGVSNSPRSNLFLRIRRTDSSIRASLIAPWLTRSTMYSGSLSPPYWSTPASIDFR